MKTLSCRENDCRVDNEMSIIKVAVHQINQFGLENFFAKPTIMFKRWRNRRRLRQISLDTQIDDTLALDGFDLPFDSTRRMSTVPSGSQECC